MSETEKKFTPFYGGVFSQWYPCQLSIDGVEYNCAEQYMMAQKARVFGDLEALEAIMATDNPSDQKALGRRVRGFKREVWDMVSRDVVMRASLAKFSNPKLRAVLLLTEGTTLVEASPTDDIWGVKLVEGDPRVHDPEQWQGTNWLGQVLTDLREYLLVLSNGPA